MIELFVVSSFALALALWAAPITSVTGAIVSLVQWFAQQTQSGGPAGLSPIISNSNNRAFSNYTATGTTTANAINQIASTLYSIAGGGSTTIDLSATLRNIVNDTAATFARIKAIQIRLLSTTQDAVNGTAASSVTIGNAAGNQFRSQSGSGFFENTTDEFVIPNGGWFSFGVENANGVAVDGTHKDLKILNNDGAVTAKVEVTIMGADA